MIIPVGTEKETVRRMPWVSFGIIILCFVIHLFIITENKSKMPVYAEKSSRFFFLFFTHPYLEMDPRVKDRINLEGGKLEEILEMVPRLAQVKPPQDPSVVREQQEELDRRAEEFIRAMDELPFRRYGFIPQRRRLFNSVSYAFVHGGWMHLLFNLYLFYLLGYCIEDAWGRIIFTAFYILGAVISAYMYAFHFPDFAGPLIGASGAIAAVMGAFLVRFWKMKIKFVWIFWFIYGGVFKATAWVVLLIWLVIQVLNAGFQQSMMKDFGLKGGGTAYWAHVWGFIFGAVVAWTMKYFKVEERYVSPSLDRKDRYVDSRYALFNEALQLREEGKIAEAFERMIRAVEQDPLNESAGENLWEMGVLLKRQSEAREPYLKMVEAQIRQHQYERALVHFRELKEKFPDLTLSLRAKILLLGYFNAHQLLENAGTINRQIAKEMSGKTAPGLVFAYLKTLLASDPQQARAQLSLIREHPDIPPHQKREWIRQLETRTRQPEVSPSEPANPGREESAPFRENISISRYARKEPQPMPPGTGLKVILAIPVAVKEDCLAIFRGGTSKALPYGRIQVISVVRIRPAPPQPSHLVVDLLLNRPAPDPGLPTVVRFLSHQMDPRKLVPGAADARQAFVGFIHHLVSRCRARLYPDPESVFLKKLRVYPSISQYEQEWLQQAGFFNPPDRT